MSAATQISWDEAPQKAPDIKWDEAEKPAEETFGSKVGRGLKAFGKEFVGDSYLGTVGGYAKSMLAPQLAAQDAADTALKNAKAEGGDAYAYASNAAKGLPVLGSVVRAGESQAQGKTPEAIGQGAAGLLQWEGLRSPETVSKFAESSVEPVRSTVSGAGKLTNKVASAPIIRHLPGARTARLVAKDAIDLTKRPAEFPGASLPAHPGEFPGAHLPAHPGEFPGAPFPEAPPVQMPFQPSDTPAPVRLGPGQVPADIIGATNDRVLPAGQGVRTTPIALLPESTDAPPVQSPSLSPKLAPPHIELPPRFSPRYDLMEDKAFQDSANADLERHGRRAFKEERDQFEAGNKVDVPKGELTKQFREGIGKPENLAPGWSRPTPVRSKRLTMVGSSAGASADTNYFQAARQALGEKASVSDAAQLAQKLKESGIEPGASLEELLKKSIEMAKQKKK